VCDGGFRGGESARAQRQRTLFPLQRGGPTRSGRSSPKPHGDCVVLSPRRRRPSRSNDGGGPQDGTQGCGWKDR